MSCGQGLLFRVRVYELILGRRVYELGLGVMGQCYQLGLGLEFMSQGYELGLVVYFSLCLLYDIVRC